MKKRIGYIWLPIVSVVLELVPYGAVCHFARPSTDGTIGHFKQLYAYFDPVPFGYANFAPLVTAWLTLLALLLLIFYVLLGKRMLATAAKWLTLAAAVCSFGPLALGVRYYSLVGALISATLWAEWALVRYDKKG